MPNGYYEPGTAAVEDCYALPASVDNSGTYMYVGTGASAEAYRSFVRYQMDIPSAAIIDEAYMYAYIDAKVGTPTSPIIDLVDTNNSADYTSNPYASAVVNAGDATSVAFAELNTVAAVNWAKSSSIKGLVKHFIDGKCAGGGYTSGNYMGLRLSGGGANSNYARLVQSNYASGVFAVFLLVAYHTDYGKCAKFVQVAASGDDTWNKSDDGSTNRSTEASSAFGADSAKTPVKRRAFMRFSLAPTAAQWGVPKSATLYAAYFVGMAQATGTGSFTPTIQVLSDESSFSSGMAYSRGVIGSAINLPDGYINVKQKTWSATLATMVSARIAEADYDPAGAGNYPYIGFRIGEGDAGSGEQKYLSTYDSTAGHIAPILVVCYESPYADLRRKRVYTTTD